MMACERCVYGTGEHAETCEWVLLARSLLRGVRERAEKEYRERIAAAAPKPEEFLKY